MRYHNRKNGLGLAHSLTCFIAATVFCVSLTGCATPKHKPEAAISVFKSAETINLHFKRPLLVWTPENDPATTEEHIRCGLFYFAQERFAASANEFGKARKKIFEDQNPLYRACLMSTATCHLLADNKQAFMQTIKELKATYNRYELIVVKDSDDRVNVLYELYNRLIKTGNF